jgi:hypothetical protein
VAIAEVQASKPAIWLRRCARLGQERCEAYMELVELVELAEMPPEFMGWA